MKTTPFLSSVAMVCALTASCWAMDGGTSPYQGSIFNMESQKTRDAIFKGAPTMLSVGGYYSEENRVMEVDGVKQDWKINNVVAYIALDVTPWLTIRGGGGQNDLSIDEYSRDSDLEWIAGGTLRILDYFAMDPMVGPDPYWVNVLVDGQYTGGKSSDEIKGDLTWNEVYAAMLITLTSKTERWGFMDRISLYAGPAYSAIVGSQDGGFGADIREDRSYGLVAGLAFNPSENLTIKTELQNFDKTSFGIGASFHF